MKDKYHIKHLGFVPPPYGGVSVYIRRLIEKLGEDGLLSGAYYLDPVRNKDVIDSPLFHKWEWLRTRDFFKRFRLLRKEVESFRIVHSHFSLEGMMYLWGLKTFCGKKIVVTVHNSMVGNYYGKTNILNKIFLNLLSRRNIVWIAVSQQAKQEMEKLPVRFKNEIHVIPAYIPVKLSESKSLPESLDRFVKNGEKVITFYGHSFMKDGNKDIYGFVEVLEMYSSLIERNETNARLVYCIADKSEEKEIAEIKSLALEKNISDRIYWQIGPLDNMQALWKETDVYVRPTSTDGDSVAVREALDLGLQVVASDVCERPDGVLTYEYGDNRKFAEKVAGALNSGRKLIKEDYTHYNHMLDIYKDILKSDNL